MYVYACLQFLFSADLMKAPMFKIMTEVFIQIYSEPDTTLIFALKI
jgi:hypothetical protein